MVLPNVSFAISVWYLVPPTLIGVTHITSIGLIPINPELALVVQETVANIPVKEIPIAKPMITTKKTNKRGKKVESPTTQWEIPICDVVGHPTHICLELDELKSLLSSEVDIVTPRSHKKELATKI